MISTHGWLEVASAQVHRSRFEQYRSFPGTALGGAHSTTSWPSTERGYSEAEINTEREAPSRLGLGYPTPSYP